MSEEAITLLEDVELIELVKSGDLDAFGVLYERYLDPIYRYITTRVSDEQDAEDLTEYVFLRSFESLHRYEDRGLPYSAFLYRVARNVLIDHYRSRVDDAQVELDRTEAAGCGGLALAEPLRHLGPGASAQDEVVAEDDRDHGRAVKDEVDRRQAIVHD